MTVDANQRRLVRPVGRRVQRSPISDVQRLRDDAPMHDNEVSVTRGTRLLSTEPVRRRQSRAGRSPDLQLRQACGPEDSEVRQRLSQAMTGKGVEA